MRRHQRRGRIRDWFLYIGIAAVIVAAAVGYGAYQGKVGGSTDLPLKWLGFFVTTAIVFGYAIHGRPPSWRARKFWLLLAVLLLAYLGVGVLVLARVESVPLVLYALLAPVEYVVLIECLGRFLGSN
jgi:hypothetical protein